MSKTESKKANYKIMEGLKTA